jgi:uncharacterized membrane protein
VPKRLRAECTDPAYSCRVIILIGFVVVFALLFAGNFLLMRGRSGGTHPDSVEADNLLERREASARFWSGFWPQ